MARHTAQFGLVMALNSQQTQDYPRPLAAGAGNDHCFLYVHLYTALLLILVPTTKLVDGWSLLAPATGTDLEKLDRAL